MTKLLQAGGGFRSRCWHSTHAVVATEPYHTVVVGAGITGLSTAFTLTRPATGATTPRVLVTEGDDRIGGNVRSRRDGDYLWEEGPNSFQPIDAALTLAVDAGLRTTHDIRLCDPSKSRFVYHQGDLHPLPASGKDAMMGDFLSLNGKIRAALGAVGWKDPPPFHEETIAEFVTRNLGAEAFDRLIEPFCGGVFAGDATKLSASAAIERVQRLEVLGGSLVKGSMVRAKQLKADSSALAAGAAGGALTAAGEARDIRLPAVRGQTVGSFKEGLGQLPKALASHLPEPVRCQWMLQKIEPSADGYELMYDTPSGLQKISAKHVVLTMPSGAAAKVLQNSPELNMPKSAAALSGIEYPCVAAVSVVYPKSAFREPAHDKGTFNGFGQLHPRCPSDEALMLHYIGGARDPGLWGGIEGLSEEELVEQTHKDTVKSLLKPEYAKQWLLPKVLSVKMWPQAIPQYNVGHQRKLDTMQGELQEQCYNGTLFLAGNYQGGVAFGKCIENGIALASRLREQ